MTTLRKRVGIILAIRFRRKQSFTSAGIYKYTDNFSIDYYPRNKHMRDAVRRVLQELRDEGKVRFVNNAGLYQRL